MTKSKLFDSWTFQIKLPLPFDDAVVEKVYYDIGSQYNKAAAKKSTLHAPTLKAILAYLQIMEGKGRGAIGFRGNTLINAEYDGASHLSAVVFHQEKHKFYAAVFDAADSSTPRPYTLVGKGGETGSALMFALMPLFLADDEFSQAYSRFEQLYRDGAEPLPMAKEAALMCDNVYRRIIGADALGAAGIKLELPTTGNITQLTKLMIEEDVYSPDQILCGQFQVFKLAAQKESGSMTIQDQLAGVYQLSDKIFSPEEQLLIPEIPDWYVVPEEVLDISGHIKGTSAFNRPIRNVMLRGDSGVGKTEAAKAIAAALRLPYYVLTCHPSMEIYDLIGQMLPVNMTAGVEEGEAPQELPGFFDLTMDPATVMCQLSGGEYDESTTADAAFAALLEACRQQVLQEVDGKSGQRFQFVKSPLLKALETGALIELQEPTVINAPGVLAGLNGLLDAGQMISLPTGEVVRRDPNSVVVMTTNVGYAGCRELNQSIISRMQMIIDMNEPDAEAINQRVQQVSGCQDEEMTRLMTNVFLDIKRHCQEKLINDGSVGMRELIDWVESYMVTKNAYKSAFYTIIPSASMDAESRQDIIDTCLLPKIYHNS